MKINFDHQKPFRKFIATCKFFSKNQDKQNDIKLFSSTKKTFKRNHIGQNSSIQAFYVLCHWYGCEVEFRYCQHLDIAKSDSFHIIDNNTYQ